MLSYKQNLFKILPLLHDLLYCVGTVLALIVSSFMVLPLIRDGAIRSSIGIGPDTNIIQGSEISDPTFGDFQSMSHVCALTLSAEMTPQVIPAGWLNFPSSIYPSIHLSLVC